MTHIRGFVTLLAVCTLLWPAEHALAQGVTTGAVTGIVTNTQQEPVAGASVIAIHEPSGTTYEAVTRADGRFSMPGMRVGGPYSVTIAYVGAGGTAFAPETQVDIMVNLGVGTDLVFSVQPIAVQEEITVTAQVDPVFSSSRTGASTSVSRADIAMIPTVSGNIADLTRLTPQATGRSFGGQDNRQNNMTVDGSYFNSPFGLGQGQPGGRTMVAPISLESIEQVQVSVAPFDVRQGNFIGGGVNTVTRSGTNQLSASVYHRMRNEDYVGTEAMGLPVNPGTFTFRNTGVWAGAPIVRNKLFVFGNYEDEKRSAPLHTFTANTGGQPVSGNVSRVLASDLDTLSAYLKQNFSYDTGGYENLPAETPAKRYLLRTDYNMNNSNKVSFRYSQLDSSDGKLISGSSSAGLGRTLGIGFLPFEASNYAQLENIKSGIGEWNAVIGSSMSNSLIAGYTTNNENRTDPGKLFPFVDILGPDGTAYASLGTEPFTPNNELLYKTYQLQDNLTRFSARHSLTFGFTMQRYEAENSFFNCCKQGAYVYNSLADFYADANGFLANPNRTTSPITPRRYQVRWMNIPGLDKPLQNLNVWNLGGYAQDEWRPRANLTLTAGARLDIPAFDDTTYPNPNADALVFRDETGSSVSYSSGNLPDAKVLFSPRVGFNWDVAGNQQTQVRGGTGIFTGPPLYVWISNQLGNTGVLQGSLLEDNPTTRPFHSDIDRYKPANVTGAPAASYELNVTDNSFKFPQVWKSNIAVDRRLPGGITGTAEFIYNKDVNGIYYINANLPAAQSAFTGVDNRPRWVGTACAAPTPGPCVTRINNAAGNQVTAAIVMKNQSVGNSWNVSGSLSKSLVSRAHSEGLVQLRRRAQHHRPRDNGWLLVQPQPARRRPEQSRPRTLAVGPGTPGVRERLIQPLLLRVRSHDDRGVLGSQPVAEWRRRRDRYDGQLRVRWRHERRRRFRQRPDLHSERRVGNELRHLRCRRRHVYRRTAGAGVRGVHQSGRVPAQAPWRVRRAWGYLEPVGQEDGPEHYAGHLPRHRRQAQRGAVPHRLHELRKLAQQQLGREPASGGAHHTGLRSPTADQPRRGCAGPCELPTGLGQRPAGDQDVPVADGPQRRLPVPAQLPV